MIRAAVACLIAAASLSGCDLAGRGAANCVTVDGTVEGMAWSPDGSHIAVTGTGPSPFVARVEASPARVVGMWSDDRMLGTSVTMDADDRVYWLTSGDSGGDAVWSDTEDGEAIEVAPLADPLTQGIYWTERGWRFLRWSGSGLPDKPPGERWSLVEGTIEDGNVAFGEVIYESADLRQAWLSADGGYGALLRQRAVGRPVTVTRITAAGEDDLGSHDGISGPSMPDPDTVLVRRASDGALVYLGTANEDLSVAVDGDFLLGAASSGGALATAAIEPRGRSKVCTDR